MDISQSTTLEGILANWPIAIVISQNLPAGSLITLARTSANLRAALHGFENADDVSDTKTSGSVRSSIRIGDHDTAYWRNLKESALFLCSEKAHTKGLDPKPCRYCSRPICEACIVRSSFARRNENTFQNRRRYLCEDCWKSGNRSRSSRLPLGASQLEENIYRSYSHERSDEGTCYCTLKDDGWLCLECKDKQNGEMANGDWQRCHGENCTRLINTEDTEKHRICLWCDKTLSRQMSGRPRHIWNQKIIDARARNAASRQADLEEYNRKRLRLMRMSRREMRGDEAVKNDPTADIPQFVRHLDTINYRRFMPEKAVPNGDAVYASKRGHWQYSKEFLLTIRSRCTKVGTPREVWLWRKHNGLRYARTNLEKSSGAKNKRLSAIINALNNRTILSCSKSEYKTQAVTRKKFDFIDPKSAEARSHGWYHLKASILELAWHQKVSPIQIQEIMADTYDFRAELCEYKSMLSMWSSERTNFISSRESEHPNLTTSRPPNTYQVPDAEQLDEADFDPEQKLKHTAPDQTPSAPSTDYQRSTSRTQDASISPEGYFASGGIFSPMLKAKRSADLATDEENSEKDDQEDMISHGKSRRTSDSPLSSPGSSAASDLQNSPLSDTDFLEIGTGTPPPADDLLLLSSDEIDLNLPDELPLTQLSVTADSSSDPPPYAP